jgi:hypothetical protein
MMILTEAMVRGAIELVRSTAEVILGAIDTTWGPRWVEGRVKVPGVEKILKFDFGTTDREWNPEWGKEKYFGEIAEAKLRVVEREGVNTRIVVATRPWKLKPGEGLYSGGAVRDGICVAVSGAKGTTDEAIAEMVISVIVMLAFLETERRLQEGRKQI